MECAERDRIYGDIVEAKGRLRMPKTIRNPMRRPSTLAKLFGRQD
jgi:hypothetical protein